MSKGEVFKLALADYPCSDNQLFLFNIVKIHVFPRFSSDLYFLKASYILKNSNSLVDNILPHISSA